MARTDEDTWDLAVSVGATATVDADGGAEYGLTGLRRCAP
jgi:hypothetical protein